MDKQRLYDAMLIKAFRADVYMLTLRAWLKPYDIEITDGTYERCSSYMGLRVQVMIGAHMRRLADRLWDTEKSEDVRTLDWMQDIKFSKGSSKTKIELASIKRKNDIDRREAGVWGEVRSHRGRNNQWDVTK